MKYRFIVLGVGVFVLAIGVLANRDLPGRTRLVDWLKTADPETSAALEASGKSEREKNSPTVVLAVRAAVKDRSNRALGGNAAFSATSADSPGDASLPPRAVAAGDKEFRFDIMAVETEMSHRFVIRNEGAGPLQLTPGKTTCKCTVSNVERGPVPPGGSTEVVLTWRPIKPASQFQQTAVIHTNDPESPKIELSVSGRVELPAMVEPGWLWYAGDLDKDEPVEMSGVIYSAIEKHFDVRLESKSGVLSAVAEPLGKEKLDALDARSGYSIRATLEPQHRIGRFREPLVIHTTIPGQETLTCQLVGSWVGPCRIMPGAGVIWDSEHAIFDMGEFQAQQGKNGMLTLMIASPAGKPFNIGKVDCDMPFVEVAAEPVPAAGAGGAKLRDISRVRICVPEHTAPTVRNATKPGHVRLRTNQPQLGDICFNVHFIAY